MLLNTINSVLEGKKNTCLLADRGMGVVRALGQAIEGKGIILSAGFETLEGTLEQSVNTAITNGMEVIVLDEVERAFEFTHEQIINLLKLPAQFILTAQHPENFENEYFNHSSLFYDWIKRAKMNTVELRASI